MATDTVTPPPKASTAADLGIDRAFVLKMAQIPVIALLWAAGAMFATSLFASLGWLKTITVEDQQFVFNLGPVAVICFGMLLAAFIDGYAFKVPNWVTLSLVVSGLYLGLANDLGWNLAATAPNGGGGLWATVFCTFLGFFLLFPALFIGGMGEGDVKMTMAFGSWIGAFFGGAYLNLPGTTISAIAVIWWSFAVGVIVGGIFGIVMMALRRQLHKNMQNAREIVTDLQVMMTHGPKKAAERANARRKDWTRLPYGVPLCVGFLGYLWYRLFLSV